MQRSFLLSFVHFFYFRQQTYSVNKQNGINLYALNSPALNSSIKNKTSFELFFYYRFDGANKNIKQKKGENIVQCWFYETSIKIFRLISEDPPPLLLICRQYSNVDYLKTIL